MHLDQPLDALGMDSLVAMEVRNWIMVYCILQLFRSMGKTLDGVESSWLAVSLISLVIKLAMTDPLR